MFGKETFDCGGHKDNLVIDWGRRYSAPAILRETLRMAKKDYPLSKVYRLLEPGPVVLVTTASVTIRLPSKMA
ncbi:hypothetical protein UT4_13820 [Ferrigenium sp. UT4]